MKKLYVVIDTSDYAFIGIHQANWPGDVLKKYTTNSNRRVIVQLLRNCFYLSRSDRELLVEPFAKIKRREERQKLAVVTDTSAMPEKPCGTITVHKV